MMWGSWLGAGPGGLVGVILMSTVCVLVIVGIILLVRGLWSGSEGRPVGLYENRPSPNDRMHESALEVLEARYARGEIEREEFFQRKTDLQG